MTFRFQSTVRTFPKFYQNFAQSSYESIYVVMIFFQYIPPLGSVLLQCTLYMHDIEESDVYAVKDILHKI